MKLIIQTSAVAPSVLTVVNGDDVIQTIQVYGGDLKSTIDRIFKEKYIESVQFAEHNDYTKKFEDYIIETHEGVMIE